MSSFPCPACGGTLPDVRYHRMVTCTYCSSSQPNPGCVRAGDEVLVSGGMGQELVRVTACTGPDAIEVGTRTLRLEDVIPVSRVTADLPSGTGVYRRGPVGWAFTYTAGAPDANMVKVKNENAGFQDAFFDQQSPLEDLRVDARPADAGGMHVRRTPIGRMLARFRNAPGESMFDLVFKAFFVIVFAIVGVSVLRAFVFR